MNVVWMAAEVTDPLKHFYCLEHLSDKETNSARDL